MVSIFSVVYQYNNIYVFYSQAAQLEKPDKYAKTLGASAGAVLSLCQSALVSPVASLRTTAMRAITHWVPLTSAEELPVNICITLLGKFDHFIRLSSRCIHLIVADHAILRYDFEMCVYAQYVGFFLEHTA